MHGEIFLLDRRLRHCCYTLLVFTHFHSTSWRLPQIFGRLPMRFLTSITRGHYPIKTARVLLSVNVFSWNTATRELREQGLCWPGTILSALSRIPSSIFLALFASFSIYTEIVVIDSYTCWTYSFFISLSSQYESLDSTYFEVSPATSTHVLYVVSICRGVPMSFYQQLLARHTH